MDAETKPELTMHVCGPQGECGCQCPDGPCGHVWGDEAKHVGGCAYSVVCIKCGMSALSHSKWVGQ